MSYTINVGGKIIISAKGGIKTFAKEDIVLNAGKTISLKGEENGVSFGEPEDAPMPDIQMQADAIVHFRPKKDWKGKDYGFDWMRIKDTGLFGDTEKYKDIVGTYDVQPASDVGEGVDSKAVFTESEAIYTILKKEYNSFIYTVPWLKKGKNEYFPSWLCVEKNKEIELSLRIQIKDTKKALPKNLVIGYEASLFTITSKQGTGKEDTTIDPSKNKHFTPITIKSEEDYYLEKEIKIITLADITTPQTITVYCDGKEAGFLKVYPNIVKTLNVVCIPVKLQIRKNFSEGQITGKNELKAFLNQSLISTTFLHLPLDITTINNKQNLDFNNSPAFVKNEKININKVITVLENGAETDYTLASYLDYRLKQKYKNNDGTGMYDNYLRLYYLDEDAIVEDVNGNELPVGGIGTPIGKGVGIMFKTISLPDVVHETLHAMGLGHAFGLKSGYEQRVIFKFKATENLMDYAHLDSKDKYSTWKWQWDILRRFKLLT